MTIFCFAYAFYCLSDVKCFALLSRDYLAFYCVYRDYILFCICFLLFERRKMLSLCCHVIIWHFSVFIVTIFGFACAFYCLSDVKRFALLSRD